MEKTIDEIIREHCNTEFSKSTGEEMVVSSMSAVGIAMEEYHKQKLGIPAIMQAEGSDEMCGSDCCPNDGACEHCQNPIRKSADGASVGNSAAGQSVSVRCKYCGRQTAFVETRTCINCFHSDD